MTLSMIFLSLVSGVCLLLWGLQMVKHAVLHGFGTQVQSRISKGTKNRFMAAFSGFFVTLFLQSATATALLASSFVGRGLMTASAGIAVMIGADMGTALVTKILSLKIGWIAPLLLSCGIISHQIMAKEKETGRHIARIVIGLGFMLTALAIIREATAPMSASETLPLILSPLESEPLFAITVAALLTYMMHSSVSAILLFATLTGNGVLSLDLAFYFVIGANFGVGLIPFVAVIKDSPQAAQVPLGNLIMRFIMGVVTLMMIPVAHDFVAGIDASVMEKVILAHLGFNAAILIVFLPFTQTLARICARLMPARTGEKERRKRPRYLDRKALSTPSVALSCVTRETLHMAEIVENMLENSYEALATNNRELIRQTQEMDSTLDYLFVATKKYIIDLSREELSEKETEQSIHIMNFATNLEHCGDIIDHNLMAIASGKAKAKDQFSKEGLEEIKNFHDKVVKNLKLAQSIFLSSDPTLAQQLLNYKRGLKIAENESAKSHMARLRDGLPETVATTNIHMDVIRDLRRINTYVSSVAYTILENRHHSE